MSLAAVRAAERKDSGPCGGRSCRGDGKVARAVVGIVAACTASQASGGEAAVKTRKAVRPV
jgi:hypothetical protein